MRLIDALRGKTIKMKMENNTQDFNDNEGEEVSSLIRWPINRSSGVVFLTSILEMTSQTRLMTSILKIRRKE